MANSQPLKFKQDKNGITVNLDDVAFDDVDTIIEMQIK